MQLRDDNTDTPSKDDDKETKTIIKNFTRIYHGNLQGVVDLLTITLLCHNLSLAVSLSHCDGRQNLSVCTL